MRFFALLSEHPFVCVVMEEDSYHTYTKGEEAEIEEMMEAIRNA